MSNHSLQTSDVKHFFTGPENLNLGQFIADSLEEAKAVLSKAKFVRTKHCEGNANSSAEATADGALSVADELIKNYDSAKSEQEFTYFGQHIREAWKVIKSAFFK